MPDNLPVNPLLLIWARETSGLSIAEVAQRMSKTDDTILSWESGESSPTYIQLEKMAYTIYKRPLAMFFFPDPPVEETPKESFRTLPDSEIEKLPPRMMFLLKQARAMQLNLYELTDGYNPTDKYLLGNIKATTKTPTKTLARKLRNYLGIELEAQIKWKDTDTALKAWREAIENHGIFIFKEAFKDDRYSGFCLYDEEFPIIYLNNSQPKTRQIFSLFHELAHLLMETGGIDFMNDDFIQDLSGTNKKIEIICNRFAGQFLVPDNEFNDIANTVNVNEQIIEDLSYKYKVSREVILRKFYDRDMVDQSYYSALTSKWEQHALKIKTKKKKSSGGSYYATKGVYLGDKYLSLAFSNYFQKKISISQLSNYLDLKVSNVPKMESYFFSKGGGL